jgi:mRNA interferase MazF
MNKEIQRGEIYWIDWNPGRGSEQSGRRPALVIQNDTGNRYSPTVIVASITTADNKPYQFLVHFTAMESGLPRDSTADFAMIMTIDKNRVGEKCGELSHEKMKQVDEAIKVSLGLT